MKRSSRAADRTPLTKRVADGVSGMLTGLAGTRRVTCKDWPGVVDTSRHNSYFHHVLKMKTTGSLHFIDNKAHLHYDLFFLGLFFVNLGKVVGFLLCYSIQVQYGWDWALSISCLMELLRMTESFLEKSSEAAIFVDDLPSQQPIRDREAPTALSTQLAVIAITTSNLAQSQAILFVFRNPQDNSNMGIFKSSCFHTSFTFLLPPLILRKLKFERFPRSLQSNVRTTWNETSMYPRRQPSWLYLIVHYFRFDFSGPQPLREIRKCRKCLLF